jgi:hypothetical protein
MSTFFSRALRFFLLVPGICLWPVAGHAEEAMETPLKPALALPLPHPEVLRPGQCVRYPEEGEAGSADFWLEGEVLAVRYEEAGLGLCPLDWQRPPVDRHEFLAREARMPCLRAATPSPYTIARPRVRLKVLRWETSWNKASARFARLYRGAYLDQPLRAGMELEIDAALLVPCRAP